MILDPNYASSEQFKKYIGALDHFHDPDITKQVVAERMLVIDKMRYKMGLYASASTRLEELRALRAELVSEYRWLIDALLYTPRSGVAVMREEVDGVANTLHNYSLEIQALEAYKMQLLDDTHTQALKRQRHELLKHVGNADQNQQRIAQLKKLHAMDRQLLKHQPTHDDTYALVLPKPEGKLRQPKKVHKGGNSPDLQQLARVKRVVLQRFWKKK